MGISGAGFQHVAIAEWNSDACQTIRVNKSRGVNPVAHWPDIYEGDVCALDYKSVGAADLVSGGPPCQPFSFGGKGKASADSRDMWPQAVRAVREVQPRAFIFENVRGLTRKAFSEYFEHVILQLTFPKIVREPSETWEEHRARLLGHQASSVATDLRYDVSWQVLNAADYGVPQRRHRVFLVGFRSDLNIQWSFPKPTHSKAALQLSQYGTGEYWDRHGMASDSPLRVAKSSRSPKRPVPALFPPTTAPWVTVRDALAGLPEPIEGGHKNGVLNHRLHTGARSYPGHTGSPLDEPAKALKAGVHGVPGGENMLRRPDGSIRYFSIRESARLQTFPEDYAFHGAWGEIMRQLGNAVPVQLGRVVADAVFSRLQEARPSEPIRHPPCAQPSQASI